MSQLRSSLWAALSAAFLLAACGGSTPAPVSPEAVATETVAPEGESAPAEILVDPSEAQIGDKTTCLVSKHTFTVSADSPTVEHEGKKYFFCCPGCDDTFMKDPAKYLGSSS